MKTTAQLIQNQFSKVGKIFPKPTLNTNSQQNATLQTVEQKK